MEILTFVYNVASAFVAFFTDVLWQVIVDWWALPPGERLGRFLAFFGAIAALLEGSRWAGQRIFKTRARLERHIEWLESEIEGYKSKLDHLQHQLSDLEAEAAELRAWLPSTALKAAERERRDGNDTSEARILGEYVSKIAPSFAEITRALTRLEVSFSIEVYKTPSDRSSALRRNLKFSPSRNRRRPCASY